MNISWHCGCVLCRCDIRPTSVELVSWCCKCQVSWMRSEVVVHQHQTCISMITMKWCSQTDVYHWSWELALILSQISVWDVVHKRYHRVCSRWVSKQLSDQQKLDRIATSLTNLHCYKAECTDFLSHIITHGCTILNHRLRCNSWCWKIQLANKEVNENCEHGADTIF
jgi:hypothetical protein